jgi:hypothetical protein
VSAFLSSSRIRATILASFLKEKVLPFSLEESTPEISTSSILSLPFPEMTVSSSDSVFSTSGIEKQVQPAIRKAPKQIVVIIHARILIFPHSFCKLFKSEYLNPKSETNHQKFRD